jgi:hypothetical protein
MCRGIEEHVGENLPFARENVVLLLSTWKSAGGCWLASKALLFCHWQTVIVEWALRVRARWPRCLDPIILDAVRPEKGGK